LHVTTFPRRICPICPRCGLRTMITRISPHPDQQPGALLCTYECCCGETISQKEN
jgi:hypothetical protein